MSENFHYYRKPKPKTRYEDDIIIYFVLCEKLNAVKVGKSTEKGLMNRLAMLQTGNPYELTLIKTIRSNHIEAERLYLSLFTHYHIRGEWFEYSKEVQSHIRSAKDWFLRGLVAKTPPRSTEEAE